MSDLTLENHLWHEGYRVVGCDEAGRGTWAGPMYVGAVTIHDTNIWLVQHWLGEDMLRDSKKMTETQRYTIYREMMSHNVPYAVGDATSEEIDRHGIEKAFGLALNRAVSTLMELEKLSDVEPSGRYQKTTLLVDGEHYSSLRIRDMSLSEPDYYEVVAEDKLDDACATVALASIVAKVHQQVTMLGMSKIFPKYGFEKHSGYPTKAHRDAVAKHGLSVIHRVSWEVKP